MNHRILPLGAFGFFLVTASGIAQSSQPPLCDSIIVRLVNQLVFQVPIDDTARVEVRRCGEKGSEVLQIAAWEARTPKPSLIIDTTDFTVVQTAARQNLYIIETTGGLVTGFTLCSMKTENLS